MQLAFSSIVQAMLLNGFYAVVRMVTGNNFAPKLGVAVPRVSEQAHCLLWVQVGDLYGTTLHTEFIHRCHSQKIIGTIPSNR